MSSGGIGFTVGTQKQSTDMKGAATTAAASTIGSIEGDVVISAGGNYRQVGSDVLTPGGDIDISAERVTIEEARETNKTVTATKFKQSGLSVSLSSR